MVGGGIKRESLNDEGCRLEVVLASCHSKKIITDPLVVTWLVEIWSKIEAILETFEPLSRHYCFRMSCGYVCTLHL